MPDTEKRWPDLIFASVFALLMALAIDAAVAGAALRDRASLKRLAEGLGTELPGYTAFAYSIEPSAIVVAAILIGIVLAGKEFAIRRPLVCCLINISSIVLISALYWGYHHALLSPIIITIHSLS